MSSIRQRIVSRSLLALALLLALLIAATFGVLGTQTGTSWLANTVKQRLNNHMTWQSLSGSILSQIDLTGLRVNEPGLELSADSVSVSWNPRRLLEGALEIEALAANGVVITVTDDQQPPAARQPTFFNPASLQLPLHVELTRLTVTELMIRLPQQVMHSLDSISMSAHLRGDELSVENLRLLLPSGSAQFDGSLALRQQMPFTFSLKSDLPLPSIDQTAVGTSSPGDHYLHVEGEAGWGEQTSVIAQYDFRITGVDKLQFQLPREIAASGIIEAQTRDNGLSLTSLTLGLREQPLTLNLTGELDELGDKAPVFSGQLEWRDAAWPLSPNAATYHSPSGKLSLKGTVDSYVAALDAEAYGDDIPALALKMTASGNQTGATIDKLTANVLDGIVSIHGDVKWQPKPRWQLEASASAINITSYVPEHTAPLSAALSVTGTLDANDRLTTSLSLASLDTQVEGLPANASGVVDLEGETLMVKDFTVNVEKNSVTLAGHISATSLGIDWDLAVTEPNLLAADLRGVLTGSGRINGSLSDPMLSANIRGSNLGAGAFSIKSLTLALDAGIGRETPLNAQLLIGDIFDGDSPLASELSFRAAGTLQRHDLALSILGEAFDLVSTVNGGLTDTSEWQGQLRSLTIENDIAGSWALDAPAGLLIAKDNAMLDAACLLGARSGEMLCAETRWVPSGESQISARLSGLELSALVSGISGVIAGDIRATLGARGEIAAKGSLSLEPGKITLPTDTGDASLTHGGGAASILIDDAGLSADADFAAPAAGRVSASLQLPGMHRFAITDEQAIAGRLDASLPDLSVASALIGPVARSTGSLSAKLAVNGVLSAPTITGELALQDGALDIPLAGLNIHQFNLRANTDADQPEALEIAGSLTSGPGRLNLNGSWIVPESRLNLRLSGDRVSVFNTSDANVLMSSDLQVGWEDAILSMAGHVNIPSARITPQLRMERSSSDVAASRMSSADFIAPSQDVVILGAQRDVSPPAVDVKAPFKIDATIDLVIGDDVSVDALGLTSRVGGGVRFTLRPDRDTLIPEAQGAISLIEGTFKSFGQDLDIETGQLIFSEVPATEPEILLRAVRWISNDPYVSAAGIEVTGQATTPELSLFSRPQLEPSQIQSYLLTGAGSGSVNSDTTLAIGTYLTDRIYVGYGYNLLEQTSEFNGLFTVTPRYGVGADVGEADSNFNLTVTHEN